MSYSGSWGRDGAAACEDDEQEADDGDDDGTADVNDDEELFAGRELSPVHEADDSFAV